MALREWEGTAWQDFCIELLQMRYADHDLVIVPDRHNGDLGLEAFTHGGVVFQCYAAQEPLSTKALFEHQRAKLTTDLGKLKKNQTKLARMFQHLKIHRYVFLVPRHHSVELVLHASSKAADVRSWNLPFIHPDFNITVETDDNYKKERDMMVSIPAQLVNPRPIGHKVLQDWGSENSDLLQEGRRKLNNIGMRDEQLEGYLTQLSSAFLRGENGLTELRTKYPSAWSAVSMIKSDKEEMLALAYPPGSVANGVDVAATVHVIAIEIERDGGIPARLATQFAWSMVADWILRCPLDFPEPR